MYFLLCGISLMHRVLTAALGSSESAWVRHAVKDGHEYFYNLESRQGTWDQPEDFQHNSSQLSREDIQVRTEPQHINTDTHTLIRGWAQVLGTRDSSHDYRLKRVFCIAY